MTHRGTRVITCPANGEAAAVTMKATTNRLKSCSRWPEMAGCAEDCLAQIAKSPNGCLAHSMVAKWYAGRHCVFCGHAMENIVWHERPAALRLPDGATREWKEIAPQDLSRIFATCEPVCWACHVVESFRREQPAMVIERRHVVEPHHVLEPSVNAVY